MGTSGKLALIFSNEAVKAAAAGKEGLVGLVGTAVAFLKPCHLNHLIHTGIGISSSAMECPNFPEFYFATDRSLLPSDQKRLENQFQIPVFMLFSPRIIFVSVRIEFRKQNLF